MFPTSLRAIARDRVVRPTVNRGFAWVVRHNDLGGAGSYIAGGVRDAEEDRVNTTVTIAFSLRTQLDRLAIGCNHDVLRRVAVAVAVLDLVARHLSDDHGGDRNRSVTVIVNARHTGRTVQSANHLSRRPPIIGAGKYVLGRF